MRKKKNIAILGSTGSIGQQTLEVIHNLRDKFNVTGLAAGQNTDLLQQQIDEFKPALVYAAKDISLPSFSRKASMQEIASDEAADIIMLATSGKAGLEPALAAFRAGKNVALANKEVLVMAGSLIMEDIKTHGGSILPVDSEHSAVWQCLKGEGPEISRLVLTASGGPFYGFDSFRLATVSAGETLKHPTWKMGRKVTVDSATLMNKGLEAIEAHWLFDLPFEKIEIVVHRQSIIHSMLEFADGSIKAQMSYPDMRYPIQYALTHPLRLTSGLPGLDFKQVNSLSFESLDYANFPCVSLALDAGKYGGTYPTALCAADEIAVQLFLDGMIGFMDISHIVEEVLNSHDNTSHPVIEDILQADTLARNKAIQVYKRIKT